MNNGYYKFASFLHGELERRDMNPSMLFSLMDEKVPMWTIWRWLRGESIPNGWQLALLMQRFQKYIDYKILMPTNAHGVMVKSLQQTFFPSMRDRK